MSVFLVLLGYKWAIVGQFDGVTGFYTPLTLPTISEPTNTRQNLAWERLCLFGSLSVLCLSRQFACGKTKSNRLNLISALFKSVVSLCFSVN